MPWVILSQPITALAFTLDGVLYGSDLATDPTMMQPSFPHKCEHKYSTITQVAWTSQTRLKLSLPRVHLNADFELTSRAPVACRLQPV